MMRNKLFCGRYFPKVFKTGCSSSLFLADVIVASDLQSVSLNPYSKINDSITKSSQTHLPEAGLAHQRFDEQPRQTHLDYREAIEMTAHDKASMLGRLYILDNSLHELKENLKSVEAQNRRILLSLDAIEAEVQHKFKSLRFRINGLEALYNDHAHYFNLFKLALSFATGAICFWAVCSSDRACFNSLGRFPTAFNGFPS